jgi:nucleoside-diphosphate-sugar epimerase
VVVDLAGHGWSVLAVDRVRMDRAVATRRGAVQSVVADLTDYGQVMEVLGGDVDERGPRADAVVHLAAVPAPGLMSNSATFANNAVATWNVFNAARVRGVRKVVWASSETVLGLPFDTPPPYVPVDESHPPRPESTYSLTKVLEEQMAVQLCRWDGALSMVGLRFSNVMDVEDYAQFPAFDADPLARKWNLWGYIDARDGAQAVRRGLEYPGLGCEVFVIANADTVMSRSSASLMAEVFPEVEVRRELGEHETLLCIDKARRVLGYEPEHTWRDHV